MHRSAAMTRPHSTIHAIAAAVVGDMSLDLRGRTSPDGAVTLLFTDVADAEEIAAELGEERANEVFQDHSVMVCRVVEALAGNVVRSERDGFLISFTSVHDGLYCAMQLQRTFAGRRLSGARRPFQLRIGLHTGHVITDAQSLFGRTVVLAARIADRSEGGQILVSSTLKRYVDTDPGYRFERLGDFYFRGVAGEHTLYSVRWQDAGDPEPPARPSSRRASTSA
jgi:adenylate cyclase